MVYRAIKQTRKEHGTQIRADQNGCGQIERYNPSALAEASPPANAQSAQSSPQETVVIRAHPCPIVRMLTGAREFNL
ncbi:MAG: hypothetical protein C0183_00685 [Roseiflexus castenholzii]|nr:MAG: hypothetical protein C0183_00685 [Roseiflexus castenholzii]